MAATKGRLREQRARKQLPVRRMEISKMEDEQAVSLGVEAGADGTRDWEGRRPYLSAQGYAYGLLFPET